MYIKRKFESVKANTWLYMCTKTTKYVIFFPSIDSESSYITCLAQFKSHKTKRIQLIFCKQ